MKTYHVYILTNRHRTVFYVGVTGNLECRLWAHASGQGGTFTSRYRVRDLIYAEAYGRVEDAIRREKELKGWRREKKLALVRGVNPELRTLAVV